LKGHGSNHSGFDRSQLYSDEGPPIGELRLASFRFIAAFRP